MIRSVKIRVAGVFLLVTVMSVVWHAPAVWLDRWLEKSSGGILRLAEPSGTVWQGQGTPVANFSRWTGAAGNSAQSPFQQMSSAVSWTVGFDFATPALTVSLRSSALQWSDPVAVIRLSTSGLAIPAGQWALEPLRLHDMGGVAGLAKLSGRSRWDWPDLVWGWNGVLDLKSQKLSVAFPDLASGLTPIRPLGDYQIIVRSDPDGTYPFLVDSSNRSVVIIKAQGQWKNDLTLKGTIQCQRLCDYLVGLMSTIGRRNGEVYEFSHP